MMTTSRQTHEKRRPAQSGNFFVTMIEGTGMCGVNSASRQPTMKNTLLPGRPAFGRGELARAFRKSVPTLLSRV